jgi:hypothetical protein
MVVVYVDDILVGGSDRLVKEISSNLQRKFQMTENEVNHFLGIRVTRTEDGTITLSQDAYIDKLITTFEMSDCKTRATPAEGYILPTKDGTPGEFPDYRKIIGALQFLSIMTRPDITFAVNQAARHCNAPTKQHMTAARRIVKYLKGTKHHGLMYKPLSKNRRPDLVQGHSSFRYNKAAGQTPKTREGDAVRGYSDADWGSDSVDRRSHSGYVFLVYGGTVSWRSKKQPTVATSSCESEIIALSMSMKEALWLRMLMLELKLHPDKTPIKVYEDNQGAKALVTDPKFSDKSKHIDIQFLRIREEIRNEKISVPYCPTSEMLADMFTKPLSNVPLINNMAKMNMHFGDQNKTRKPIELPPPEFDAVSDTMARTQGTVAFAISKKLMSMYEGNDLNE